MKSYKIIENGKPIKQVEIEKPIPVGDEILVKTCLLYTSPSPRD